MSERRFRLQLFFTQPEKEAVLEWAKHQDTSPGPLFGKTALAWKEGRVFIVDEATLAALMDASMERTRRIARREAEAAVRQELYRQGFTLTPHDK